MTPVADQCPRCKSTNTVRRSQKITTFLAAELAVCGGCGSAWEPIDTSQLTDPANLFSAFKSPCDNCAFRPGSGERKSKRKWRGLIGQLTSDPYAEFHCHKGVPIWIGGRPKGTSELGFDYDAYPRRPCAGWLALQRGILAKALRVMRGIRERATRRPA